MAHGQDGGQGMKEAGQNSTTLEVFLKDSPQKSWFTSQWVLLVKGNKGTDQKTESVEWIIPCRRPAFSLFLPGDN